MNNSRVTESPDLIEQCKTGVAAIVRWCRANPLAAVLVATIAGTFAFFFGAVPLYVNGTETAARWSWLAWNPEQDQEHSMVVPFVFVWLVWFHWEEIMKAPKRSNPLGLVFTGFGIILFLLSTRCLEPRIALLALPFLFFGSILFLWGSKVARILLFPCAFLIFLIPFGVIQNATASLQFISVDTVSFLANHLGISNNAVGTTINAQNGSFHFDVAEGCSGIHSLIAITMLTAIYIHITHNELWKKVVVLACSMFFAIIGNIGRIFTILVVAKLFNADIAGGKYHTISGYIIYPFAILAMIGLSCLLDLNKGKVPPPSKKPQDSPDLKPGRSGESYDYDY